MKIGLELNTLIDLLCRNGTDPVLQAVLGIDEAQLKRLRQEAARDTASGTAYKPFGIETAFGTSKMSPEIYCPPGVKHEIRLDTIFLYREGKNRFKQYCGLLPFGLLFGAKLAEVRLQHGTPLDEKGGEFIQGLGILTKRLKYDAGRCFVWLEFDNDDELEMVSLVGYCYKI